VSVFVIDWTTTGIDDPTGTPPTHVVTVSLRTPNDTLLILAFELSRKISVAQGCHDALDRFSRP
jgi:hypothetical protein